MLEILKRKLLGKIASIPVGLDNHPNLETWVKNELAKIPAGKKILDAGAGECRYKQYCSHLAYTSQDFCQYDGIGDGRGFQEGSWNTQSIDIVSDITEIPCPDETFEVVLCTEVLEHVPDPVSALTELSRVLAKNGTILITVPNVSLTHFAPFHFATGFNRYFFEHHLPKLGFSDIEITPNGDFFSLLAQETRRSHYIFSEENKNALTVIDILTLFKMLNFLKRARTMVMGTHSYACYGYFIKARKSPE
jgi:ubiquinone/menaquinone biosynthesis C-methylase UbiE